MGVRSKLAVGLGRACSWGLRRLAHREASQLPGRVALAVDPQALAHLATKVRQGSIVVCGTNGKTTTNNIVASAIAQTGAQVLCNWAGANMAAGVTAALLPERSCDWAVLEVDELSMVHVLPALQPKLVVLLNLFRDQLDRAGEIDHVQDTIVEALRLSPNTTLLVCGDDPLSMGVARRVAQAGMQVLSFGMGEDLGLPADRVPEARFCQVCGAELSYDYRSYAQLGAFRCPSCDFAQPQLDFVATEVEVGRSGVAFTAGGSGFTQQEPTQIHANFGGVYIVYNLLAAYAAANMAGVDGATFQRTLETYHPQNGRHQRFGVNGREVVLNLAKNPTGFNQNIALLLADERPKAAFFVVNDDFNDGRDISWIWDVDFERLAAQPDIVCVYVGGTRAHDLQVRMKYAGINAPIASSVSEVLAAVSQLDQAYPLYALTNYSALWPAKAELEKIGEQYA